jgi:hypothetical protein
LRLGVINGGRVCARALDFTKDVKSVRMSKAGLVAATGRLGEGGIVVACFEFVQMDEAAEPTQNGDDE